MPFCAGRASLLTILGGHWGVQVRDKKDVDVVGYDEVKGRRGAVFLDEHGGQRSQVKRAVVSKTHWPQRGLIGHGRKRAREA